MTEDLISLFYEAEDFFFKSISYRTIQLEEGVTAYLTGVQDPHLNPIIQRAAILSADHILPLVQEIDNQDHLPWIWMVRKDLCYPETIKFLKEMGTRPLYKSIAMVKKLKNLKLDSVNLPLIVKEVKGELADWKLPQIEAYESTAEISTQYEKAHERTMTKTESFFHYVGYVNNKAVCSLTLSFHNQIARIDDVGTVLAYRNRGYGTQMVLHALRKAIEQGAKYCFLEASSSGLGIYRRLGFQDLFVNRSYGIQHL